jgi:hypothetical protein
MSVRNNHSVEVTDPAIEIAGLVSPTGEPVSSPTLASDVPPITRTLVASIRASLSELTQETSSGKWAPSEGALKSIFKQSALLKFGTRSHTHAHCTDTFRVLSRVAERFTSLGHVYAHSNLMQTWPPF